MKKIEIAFFLSILLSIPIVMGQGAPPAATWWGTVEIDGNTSTSGDVVEALVNGAVVTNTTVGAYAPGYYILDVPCTNGTNVSFKVYGVEADQSGQICSQGASTELNLTMNKTANSIACTYDNGCISGYCVDGYCCNSACTGACNLCNVSGSQGTCTDVNTECAGTDSSCYCSSGCCVACSSGYACSSYSCVASGGGGTGGGGGLTITTNVTEEEEEVIEEEEIVEEEEIPVVCAENWACGEWSECVDGTSTRTCTDSNSCGTSVSKPAESHSCVVTPESPAIPLGVGLGLVAIGTASAVIIFFIFRRKRLNLKKKQSLRTVL